MKELQILQLVVYTGLFLVALINWRRRPGQASAWLVATFGVLAAVVVAGHFLPEDSANPAAHWGTKALLATLVLFPYFLYRFTTSLIKPIAWVNVVGTALTASRRDRRILPPAVPARWRPDAPLARCLYGGALGPVGVPLCGRRRATLARREGPADRRTPPDADLSLGATGLALALVVGGEFSGGGITEVLVQFLVLAAAPLMLIGFAPPGSFV